MTSYTLSENELSPKIEPLLNVAQISRILNVSAGCVRELARKGELCGIKFVSDWRFKQSAIKEFIERNEYRGYQSRKERLAG